jgi:hypothetical protein
MTPLLQELLALAEDIGAHVVVPLLRALKARDAASAELSMRVALAAASARELVKQADAASAPPAPHA